MKFSQRLILAASISAAMVSSLVAAPGVDNVGSVDITGSNAFRSTVNAKLLALFKPATVQYAYNGTSLSGANNMLIKGYLTTDTNNTHLYTVRTSFTGSVEALRDLTTNFAEAYIPTGAATSNGGTQNATASDTAVTPDFGFSDIFQASTIYKAPTLTNDQIVAIVPFQFVASPGANAAGLTNVTPQLFTALYSGGFLALPLFSGDYAGSNGKYVYATGRNSISGTRVTTLAETGYGINNNANQYQVGVTGAGDGVADLNAGLFDNSNSSTNGYTSGGVVATKLQADSSGLSGFILGYLGLSDAAAASTGTHHAGDPQV